MFEKKDFPAETREDTENVSAGNSLAAQPKKEIVPDYKKKIQEARKAQAESQNRVFKSSVPEKNIPIDAENIINAPLAAFSNAFSAPDFQEPEEPDDYSDEEARLAVSAHDGDVFLDLFSENAAAGEEKEALDWAAFLSYCEEQGFPMEYIPLLQGLNVVLTKERCFIKVSSGPQATIFGKVKNQLENLLCTFLQRAVKIQSTIVAYELVSDDELREKAENNAQIQLLMKEFGAEIYRCYDLRHERKN